jgi:hypothetical protein
MRSFEVCLSKNVIDCNFESLRQGISSITCNLSRICEFRLSLLMDALQTMDQIAHIEAEPWRRRMTQILLSDKSMHLEQAYSATFETILLNLMKLQETIQNPLQCKEEGGM